MAKTGICLQNGWNLWNFISCDSLTLQPSFIAHFNRNTQFPIRVSYDVYVYRQWKWLKQAFCLQNFKNFISCELFTLQPTIVYG